MALAIGLFPLLYRIGARIKFVPIILACIPWILRSFINGIGFPTDSAIFCLLAFTTGIYFAQADILNSIKKYSSTRYKLLSTGVAIIAFICRIVFSIYADYFFALALIAFGIIVVSKIRFVNSFYLFLVKTQLISG